MIAFTANEWIILILVFLAGLALGMIFLAGSKWKHRYRDEHARAEELERDNEALRRDLSDRDSRLHADDRRLPPDRDGGPF